MNNDRRKQLSKASELIAEARSLIETVASEEREAYDALPESLQGGEKGERMNEVADSLDELASALEEAEGTLEETQT